MRVFRRFKLLAAQMPNRRAHAKHLELPAVSAEPRPTAALLMLVNFFKLGHNRLADDASPQAAS